MVMPGDSWVLGLDACKAGWAGIAWDGDSVAGVFGTSVADVLATFAAQGTVGVLAIDIPIGLPEKCTREADGLARQEVGPRSSSVFTTPIRRALEADDYRTASAINTQETGKSITQQAFGIRTKVLEVDTFLKTNDAAIEVVELHPEVCFAAMNGAPLVHAKKTWAGQHQRRQLLAEAGLILPSDLGELGAKAPVDDILDAAAAAWTAMRVANGQARSLPEVPEEVAPGVFAAIWV